MSAELGLADPASLAWALPAADSGAGPPLHRGWARGTTPARDLGRKIGGDTEGEESAVSWVPPGLRGAMGVCGEWGGAESHGNGARPVE